VEPATDDEVSQRIPMIPDYSVLYFFGWPPEVNAEPLHLKGDQPSARALYSSISGFEIAVKHARELKLHRLQRMVQRL